MEIYLGHGELTQTDIINLCRKNDKENHWTYNESDGNLKLYSNSWASVNELLKLVFIKYTDTPNTRMETLERILEYIGEKNINKLLEKRL